MGLKNRREGFIYDIRGTEGGRELERKEKGEKEKKRKKTACVE